MLSLLSSMHLVVLAGGKVSLNYPHQIGYEGPTGPKTMCRSFFVDRQVCLTVFWYAQVLASTEKRQSGQQNKRV